MNGLRTCVHRHSLFSTAGWSVPTATTTPLSLGAYAPSAATDRCVQETASLRVALRQPQVHLASQIAHNTVIVMHSASQTVPLPLTFTVSAMSGRPSSREWPMAPSSRCQPTSPRQCTKTTLPWTPGAPSETPLASLSSMYQRRAAQSAAQNAARASRHVLLPLSHNAAATPTTEGMHARCTNPCGAGSTALHLTGVALTASANACLPR